MELTDWLWKGLTSLQNEVKMSEILLVFLIFVIIAILRLFLTLQKGRYIMEMIGTILLYLMSVIVKSWRPQKVWKKLRNMEIKNTSKFSTQFQCGRWPEIKFAKIGLVSWLLILLSHHCHMDKKQSPDSTDS